MKPVQLTGDAENDLIDTHDYLVQTASEAVADSVLAQFEALFSDLAEFPQSGRVVPELDVLGISEYRQLLTENYRVIYAEIDSAIIVFLIAHQRRDFSTLLLKRLTRH